MNTCSGTTRSGDACQNRVAEPGGNCGRCLGAAAGSGSQDRADLIESDGDARKRELNDLRLEVYAEADSMLQEMNGSMGAAGVEMASKYWDDAMYVDYGYEPASTVAGVTDEVVAYVEVEREGGLGFIAPESKRGEWQRHPPREADPARIKFVSDDEFFEFERLGHSAQLLNAMWNDVT